MLKEAVPIGLAACPSTPLQYCTQYVRRPPLPFQITPTTAPGAALFLQSWTGTPCCPVAYAGHLYHPNVPKCHRGPGLRLQCWSRLSHSRQLPARKLFTPRGQGKDCHPAQGQLAVPALNSEAAMQDSFSLLRRRCSSWPGRGCPRPKRKSPCRLLETISSGNEFAKVQRFLLTCSIPQLEDFKDSTLRLAGSLTCSQASASLDNKMYIVEAQISRGADQLPPTPSTINSN